MMKKIKDSQIYKTYQSTPTKKDRQIQEYCVFGYPVYSNKLGVGVVSKLSSKNTIKVIVEYTFHHPIYTKIVKRYKNYLVHLPNSVTDVKVGDTVSFFVTRPVSKMKSKCFYKIISSIVVT